VAHSKELPAPGRPEYWNLGDSIEDLNEREIGVYEMERDAVYVLPNIEKPHLVNQNLVRD
jgi:hypothetical protein